MKEGGKFLFLEPMDATAHPAGMTASTDASECLEAQAPALDTAEPDARKSLAELVTILLENDLNPVTQLAGYLIAEDPTYLPEGTNARAIARRIGRDKLLETLIEWYWETYREGTDPHADL